MKLTLQDTQSAINVSEKIFNCLFNEPLVHQVITAYAAGKRQGTVAQKNRSRVSGSSKKPWRQKGTGRARSGSIRSPIWRSGGVTFAANPQNHSHKVNKKMYRGALKSIFSELIRQNRLIVVEKFSVETHKTKLVIQKLENMSIKENVLIIIDTISRNLLLATRNLHKVDVCSLVNINPISLIHFSKIIITVDALRIMEGILM